MGLAGWFKRETAFYAVLVAVLSVSVFFVLRDYALVSNPDAVNIFLPLVFDASRAVRQHGLFAMMYDPNVLAGYSHWLNANFNPAYPLYFNWLGSDGDGADTLRRLEFVVRLHAIILAVGAGVLARKFGANKWSAFVFALALPWVPAVQTTYSWVHIISSLAWVPWVLYFFAEVMESEKSKYLFAVLLGISVNFLIYAQPAQNLVLCFFACAVAGAGYLVKKAKNFGDVKIFCVSVWRPFLVSALIIGVVSGFYVYKLVEFSGESIRWIGPMGHVVGHERLPINALLEFSVDFKDLYALFFYKNEFLRQPGCLYIGLFVLVFAIFGSIGRGRDIQKSFLVVAALAFFLCVGAVVYVSYWIPLVNKIREVAWWSCLFVLILFPLAAAGVTNCLDGVFSGSIDRIAFRTLAAIGVVSAVGMVAVSGGGWLIPASSALGVSVLLYTSSIVDNQRLRLALNWLVSPLVCISAVGFFVYGYPRSDVSSSYYFRQENVVLREGARELSGKLSGGLRQNYRAYVADNFQDGKLLAHYLANNGVRMIRGDIHPQLYSKFQTLFFPSPAVKHIFGIKYRAEVVLTDAGKPSFSWVDEGDVRPWMYFRAVKPVAVDDPAAAVASSNGSSDYIKSGLMIPRQLDNLPISSEAYQSVRWYKSESGDVKAVFEASSPGVFVLNEDPSSGWGVYLNAIAKNPVPINAFQVGVYIEAPGLYEITLKR